MSNTLEIRASTLTRPPRIDLSRFLPRRSRSSSRSIILDHCTLSLHPGGVQAGKQRIAHNGNHKLQKPPSAVEDSCGVLTERRHMKVRTEAASEVVDVRRLALSSAGAAGAPPPRRKLCRLGGGYARGQGRRSGSGAMTSSRNSRRNESERTTFTCERCSVHGTTKRFLCEQSGIRFDGNCKQSHFRWRRRVYATSRCATSRRKRLDIRRNRRIYVTVINKRKIPEKCRLQLLRPAESRGDVARTPPQKIRCIAEIFCTNWRVR